MVLNRFEVESEKLKVKRKSCGVPATALFTLYFSLFIAIFLLIPIRVSAHQFLPTHATLSILSEEEYALVVEIDLIELIQELHQLDGDDADLITRARLLPYPELINTLARAREKIRGDIHLYFREVPQSLDDIRFPDDQQTFLLLRSNPDVTDYRITVIAEGGIPPGTDSVRIGFPAYLSAVNLVINSPNFQLVNAGGISEPWLIGPFANATGQSALKQILTYTWQGIIHIIPHGPDHILFVLALFLLSARLGSLIWQVTAFTVAHTITLIMAARGLVSLSADIVEPLIAFSIAFVAVENLVHSTLKPWRIIVVFGFGLLHGLGFASVLMGFGLPQTLFFTSLIAFNVGVESGQLAVIVIAFAAVGWFRKYSWYRRIIILPGSALIALFGLLWTYQRIAMVI